MRKTFNWAVLLALLAILAWVGIDAGSGRSGSAMLADNVMPAVADSDPSRLSNSGSSPIDPDFVETRNGDVSAGAFSAGPALSTPVFRRISTAGPDPVSAESALVADLQTGEAYYELSPDRRWPIASVTKLFTASFTLRNMDLDRAVTVSEADAAKNGGDFENGLKAGESYRVSDLWKALLIFSSNEAAEALANDYGRDAFILGMRELAQEWGLDSTHITDPTGLSAANQSSANDLKALARYVYQTYPGVFETSRLRQETLVELGTGRAKLIKNNNLFAGRADFIGGKTGYTRDSGDNLVSVFRMGRRPVVVIVLGAADRFEESERLWDWFRDTHELTP